MGSENLQVSMDEFLPLRDVVFNTLRKGILTGELKPGERLMEIHLANRLGVSRTPGGDPEAGAGGAGDHGSPAGSRGGPDNGKEYEGRTGGSQGTGCSVCRAGL